MNKNVDVFHIIWKPSERRIRSFQIHTFIVVLISFCSKHEAWILFEFIMFTCTYTWLMFSNQYITFSATLQILNWQRRISYHKCFLVSSIIPGLDYLHLQGKLLFIKSHSGYQWMSCPMWRNICWCYQSQSSWDNWKILWKIIRKLW